MKFTLLEKRQEASDVMSFVWKPEESITWKAGQYMQYKLPHENADDRADERWFTIASAPFEGLPMITTRRAAERGSSFKEALFGLSLGDTIEAWGVEGDFTIEDASQEYVFVAGGIGVTPFHSILKQMDHDGVKLNATLIYGNRNEEIVFRKELESFADKNPSLKIHYLVSPERIDEQSIRKLIPNLANPLFYLSGPKPMVKALAETVEKMGVASDHIKLDDFPGYPAE